MMLLGVVAVVVDLVAITWIGKDTLPYITSLPIFLIWEWPVKILSDSLITTMFGL